MSESPGSRPPPWPAPRRFRWRPPTTGSRDAHLSPRLAVVTAPETADVLWIPAEHLTDDEVAAALRTVRFRGHDTKSLMRSLLAQGIEPVGLELDTAIAAYLLRPAEARYELGHLLEDYDLRRAEGRPDGEWPARPRWNAGQRRGSRPPGMPLPSPPSSTRSRRTSPSRAWSNCTRRSRTRSSSSSPGWSTSASPSTGPPRAALPEAHRRRRPARRRPAHDLRSRRPQRQLDDQLRQILFTERGLTPVKKTKTGASTDASSLEKLQEQWPEFIGPLLQYREVEKLRGTYGEGLLLEVAADGRIHAVQPDRRPHRPAQLGPAEPAQHPGAS